MVPQGAIFGLPSRLQCKSPGTSRDFLSDFGIFCGPKSINPLSLSLSLSLSVSLSLSLSLSFSAR